jgi:hypothetical protein
MAIKAMKLKDNYGGFAGDHALYRLTQPITDPGNGITHEFVIVFATNFGGHPETIITPGREDGTAPYMARLPGSMHGVADHATALAIAGGLAYGEPYEVVDGE